MKLEFEIVEYKKSITQLKKAVTSISTILNKPGNFKTSGCFIKKK